MKYLILFLLSLLILSCGRDNPGCIVNETDQTLLVTVKFNYPHNKFCPDNYFREDIIHAAESINDSTTEVIDVQLCNVTENSAILKLKPNDIINLGTVRLDADRNDYKSWEFTEITCKGDKGYYMHAEDKELQKYISKNRFYPLSNYSHSFIIE